MLKIQKSYHAFSLVELSIVLVILGLLTGGILTGQSLIRAAEMRTIVTEFQQFQTAINTFKGKYIAMPGDMPNATQFWGAADNNHMTCVSISSIAVATCNGDGNGTIMGEPSNAWASQHEVFHAWKHLANAGLINGSYTGRQGPDDGRHHLLGVNCPASKVSNVGYSIFHMVSPFSSSWFPITQKTIIQAGGQSSTDTWTPVFTAEEAWNVDKKMDDGLPGQGKVLSQRPPGSNCPTGTDPATAQYNFSNTAKICQIAFIID